MSFVALVLLFVAVCRWLDARIDEEGKYRMFAGHFGLAAGIKAVDSGVFAEAGPSTATRRGGVPLWALMLSTQLLDVGFAVLVVMGIESYGGSTAYG